MINVGEYIRTKDGRIGKIEAIFKRDEYSDVFHTDINCDDYECKHYVYDFDIKSHSKNIIDLIEVGDIVTVEEIDTEWERTVEVDEEEYIKYLKMHVGKEEKLISILTHEMYEQNCYKVGED